jgi:hypothetical protein
MFGHQTSGGELHWPVSVGKWAVEQQAATMRDAAWRSSNVVWLDRGNQESSLSRETAACMMQELVIPSIGSKRCAQRKFLASPAISGTVRRDSIRGALEGRRLHPRLAKGWIINCARMPILEGYEDAYFGDYRVGYRCGYWFAVGALPVRDKNALTSILDTLGFNVGELFEERRLFRYA